MLNKLENFISAQEPLPWLPHYPFTHNSRNE